MDSNTSRSRRPALALYLAPWQKQKVDAAARAARMTRQRLIRAALRRLFRDVASGLALDWISLADWYADNPVTSDYLDSIMPVRKRKGGKRCSSGSKR